MLIEIKGDIFKTDCDVIGHGCNCKGGFGSGIAGQILAQFPHVRNAYWEYHTNIGWALGDVQLIGIGNGDSRIIANCATQKEYLPRNVDHSDHNAIEKVCRKLKDYCINNNKTLALPRIGCGLAGGIWEPSAFQKQHQLYINHVKEVYEKVFVDFDVKVYYL